ncbi:hypothetical protein SKDZ_11G2450 [Saccharomyces kudriavzevii ZP591]|nr:hypothetical protein SKDZ_11G2450 [Saccharomyces kudriavzevii ZP591]
MSGDDYRTSDDDDDTEKKYTRPVFVSEYRRKAYTGTTSQAEDHHYPCDRPVKRPQHHREGTQSTTIRLVPATMDRPKSRQKKKKKSASTINHGTALFEYGESIAGYRCVTTESEMNRLKQKDESESSSDSEVDIFAFDQVDDADCKLETEERHAEAIRRYWRRTKGEPAVLPLPDTPTLAVASPDIIDEHSVKRFYTMSATLVHAERQDLIRRDRIRWHPDKHRSHKAKVTKLFQVINSLWEQEQERATDPARRRTGV